MTPAFKIRKALPKDLHHLRKLFFELREYLLYWPENPPSFKSFIQQISGEDLFLAEALHQEIIGFISVMPHEKPLFIHHLFVKSTHARQGVGKALIESLFPLFPRPYQLKCLIKNQKALKFYQKNGWTEVKQPHDELEEDCILLEL